MLSLSAQIQAVELCFILSFAWRESSQSPDFMCFQKGLIEEKQETIFLLRISRLAFVCVALQRCATAMKIFMV